MERPLLLVTTAGDPFNAMYLDDPTGQFAGVASIELDGVSACSSSLLPTGTHVLTAGHCVSDSQANPFNTSRLNVRFTGANPVDRGVEEIVLHPNYNGDNKNGYDIALLELDSAVPAAIPRYELYRDFDEVGQVFELAGYGRAGNGSDGSILPTGTQRHGKNRYDALGEQLNRLRFQIPNEKLATDITLVFDFDNGNPVNDASNAFMGVADTGLGSQEVGKAFGDSGGPSFLDGKIAGITAFGGIAGMPPDFNGTEGDSSYGELMVDSRASMLAGWIEGYFDPLPQVHEVEIASTTSQHLSRRVPSGSGIQMETIPVGGAIDTIRVHFDEPVMAEQNDFTVASAITGLPYALSGFVYLTDAQTAVLTLQNPITEPDQLVLTVVSGPAGVRDLSGTQLDGNWTNPTSVTNQAFNHFGQPISSFPSGDGVAGDNFVFHFTIMPGNGSLDNRIDQDDLDLVLLNWGMAAVLFVHGDTDGNNVINQGDLDDVLLEWGLDFTSWGGGAQGAMSGGDGRVGVSVEALIALDSALERLGLDDVRKQVHIDMSLTSITAQDWDGIIRDVVDALNEHYKERISAAGDRE